MNRDELYKKSIQIAASLAKGDSLSVLFDICENQKTISTKKVIDNIERTHGFMKDCAFLIRKLSDELHHNDPI